MKKIFAVTAALAMCFTLTSCGEKISLPEDTSAIEQYVEQASETTQAEEASEPTDAVKAKLESMAKEEYVIDFEIIGIEIDNNETERIIDMYKGSELAAERGWSDEELNNMTAVKAEYYVEYDHTKTFFDDGRTEQFFYLISGNSTGGWEIADTSSPNVRKASKTENSLETTVTEREYMQNEKQLIAFLEHLKNGTSYFFEFGNPIDVYDFMDDFKIDSYSYEHRGGGVYDVKLTCSESTCELFPNGDSYWVFSYNYSTLFIPAEREEEFDVLTHRHYDSISDFSFDEKSTVSTAYNAAVDFSLVTYVFEADTEWFENHIEDNVHGFYHAHFQNSFNLTEISMDDFAKEVKKLYNVNLNPDMYKKTDAPYCEGHGGSWLYNNFAGYEETDSEIKVRVDYYGDELYLFVAVQSEYTFSKNEDGSITLQKVEKLFDSGYKPARGSI